MKLFLSAILLICLAAFAFAETTPCVETDSLSPGEQFSKANTLLVQEDYAQAIQLYESLNTSYPDWSCPWRHKGEAYYKLKDFAAATKSLEQAIATNAEHYDAYLWMAFSLNELGRYKEALTSLETALTLSSAKEVSDDIALPKEKIEELHQELIKKTQ